MEVGGCFAVQIGMCGILFDARERVRRVLVTVALHLVAMQLARSSMSVGFYLVARARCLALDRAIHFYALLDCI
jgi:hypothetical protein